MPALDAASMRRKNQHLVREKPPVPDVDALAKTIDAKKIPSLKTLFKKNQHELYCSDPSFKSHARL